ncbi:LysR family transcriptional regulator [Virgibacillus sp. W0181]|uniref:LysR family transcriptional regulator n=1 Tax=Virgibacillus sp. W0181 TaxID=3391581 RepID=UPI003F465225
MEIRQLEYFLAVCKELHFTRAAEKLNISQPSLSQQIRVLENELGMLLFDRIGKKIRITEAGQLLLKHSRNIFFELEEIHNVMDDLKDLETGRVSIGGLFTAVTYLLPPVILRYHRQYPAIDLAVSGLRSDDIRNQLIRGELDLGILLMDDDDEIDKELECIPLYMEEFALAVPATHELANKDAASLSVLKDTHNIMFPTNYFTRQILDRHCQTLGFDLHSFLEMTTMESLMDMVADGAGVTVLPKSYLEFKQMKEISIISISDSLPIGSLGIFYLKDKYMNRATRAFVDEILYSIEVDVQK